MRVRDSVVVTEASSGIGRAAAVVFARRRCAVVLAARREEALVAAAGTRQGAYLFRRGREARRPRE
ncbi:hypothetical protein [Streptomyces sp. HC307]|uniref:hypothetical protein n=1 Tax=Streptomyces flavusporus TaxID=3385496 RepID=UPI00391720D4